jgi:agmatine deiminase
MPAEWESHQATWLAWPHEQDDWPGKFEPIPWVYTEIVRHLARAETVRILVNDPAAEQQVRQLLERAGVAGSGIEFYHVPTDRSWVRDYGPLFVQDSSGRVALTDWHFNAWAKYDNWQHDDAVPAQLARHLGMACWQPRVGGLHVVLEGGSIDVDGLGLLLTTEECLLSPVQARNPTLSREDLEQVLSEHLGVREVIWLGQGIAGDDTHGHIDDLTRFVGPARVVTVVEEDPADCNHEPLQDNLERLRAWTSRAGQPLEIHTLPMPAPRECAGQRLPASYANFYIANGMVLVPTFNDPADRQALNTLADLFPDRSVVGIHAVDLVWGLGTLHCLTQQQSAPSSVTR